MTHHEKTALVVGAGSGIGRAVTLELADRGIRVLAADLNHEAVRALAEEHAHVSTLGDEGWDATDPDACDRLVQGAARELGHLDQVITTVGWTAITRFLDETPDYWRRIIDVNLMSTIYLAASAGRVMRDQGHGSIVLTASEAGVVGTSGESVYSATKAGVIALAKSLAREYARFGIREIGRAHV